MRASKRERESSSDVFFHISVKRLSASHNANKIIKKCVEWGSVPA
jgi:hypothetical protein